MSFLTLSMSSAIYSDETSLNSTVKEMSSHTPGIPGAQAGGAARGRAGPTQLWVACKNKQIPLASSLETELPVRCSEMSHSFVLGLESHTVRG